MLSLQLSRSIYSLSRKSIQTAASLSSEKNLQPGPPMSLSRHADLHTHQSIYITDFFGSIVSITYIYCLLNTALQAAKSARRAPFQLDTSNGGVVPKNQAGLRVSSRGSGLGPVAQGAGAEIPVQGLENGGLFALCLEGGAWVSDTTYRGTKARQKSLGRAMPCCEGW